MRGFEKALWVLLAVTLVGPSQLYAQDGADDKAVKTKKVVKKTVQKSEPSEEPSTKSVGSKVATPKKVDVKSLEKKYWEPKDGKFKVVQNRTYTKTKKLHLSVMPSLMLNEEYGQGFGVVGALGYYFNDRWGLEGEYQFVDIEDNDLQDAVVGLGGFANSSRVTGYYGLTGKFMPLYAKMSWLGSKIVYFDLSFGVSLGMINYQPRQIDTGANVTLDLGDEQSAFAYGFEVSQSFYLSKKLLIRVDYKQRFFNEEVFQGGGTAQGGLGDKLEDRVQDSISLNLGLTYIF
jgi:outer membrane beta-barrel protein